MSETKMYVEIMDAKELQKFLDKLLLPVVEKTATEVLDLFEKRAIEDCKKEFGVYQPARDGEGGEKFEAWASLKQKTIDNKKVRTGMDTPLLDSGDLQTSIEGMKIDTFVRAVGTYDPNGARSEYGTARAPARPWLRPVLFALKLPFGLDLRRKLIDAIKQKYKPMKS